MPHSSSNHSGTYHRFLFRSHQLRSAADEVYISAVSCSWLIRSSNSVGRAGAGGMGRPHWDFRVCESELGEQPVSPIFAAQASRRFRDEADFNGSPGSQVVHKKRFGIK